MLPINVPAQARPAVLGLGHAATGRMGAAEPCPCRRVPWGRSEAGWRMWLTHGATALIRADGMREASALVNESIPAGEVDTAITQAPLTAAAVF